MGLLVLNTDEEGILSLEKCQKKLQKLKIKEKKMKKNRI